MDTNAALFSQGELCKVVGLDKETANNWINRDLIELAEVGGRKMRRKRLFSFVEIFKTYVTNELVTHLTIPASHSAEIAKQAVREFVQDEELSCIGVDQEPTFAIVLVSRA